MDRYADYYDWPTQELLSSQRRLRNTIRGAASATRYKLQLELAYVQRELQIRMERLSFAKSLPC